MPASIKISQCIVAKVIIVGKKRGLRCTYKSLLVGGFCM